MPANVRVDYDKIISQHLKILESLRAGSGLFRASRQTVSTGYDKAWLRDNFYECLAFEYAGRFDVVHQTYRAILDIFLKHEYKIDAVIRKKPENRAEYIHARYHPDTFDEFWEEWGNKQNDAVGAILFRVGELEQHPDYTIIQNANDKRILQKLIFYLESIQYWHDPDNGMWEENEEVHASSVGACVAGLKKMADLGIFEIPEGLIEKGEQTLRKLLPRESHWKSVDLALLSLIYPYDVVTAEEREQILENIEYHLVKDLGVLRYKTDYYYNRDTLDGHSQEAEWTFGLSWLAIIYERLGRKDKAKHYLRQAMATVNAVGEIPELYFSHTETHNDNSPLGWSESMFVVALYLYRAKWAAEDAPEIGSESSS